MEPSHKQRVKCICPKCGVSYKCRMFWTGRGTPRVFCNKCKAIVEDTYFLELEPHKYETYTKDGLIEKLLEQE